MLTQDQATRWGRNQGLLKAGERATGGLLQSRIDSNPGASNAYLKFQQSNKSQAPGVRPAGVIEPLNGMQKGALDKINQRAQNPYSSGDATGALSDARGAINDSRGSYDVSMAQDYMNPYQDQVIDRYTAQAEKLRRQRESDIADSAIARGSFGSTAQGVRGAISDSEINDSVLNQTAGLLKSGYDTAVNNSRSQFNTERNRDLTAGGLLNSVASGFQRNDAFEDDMFYRRQNAALGAGNQVQDQNQKMLDLMYRERLAKMGYDDAQLGNLFNNLNAFPTGSTTTQSSNQAGDWLTSALGGGIIGDKIFSKDES